MAQVQDYEEIHQWAQKAETRFQNTSGVEPIYQRYLNYQRV
jgi:hypothetical protein